jgi:hypothetical protein
MGGGTGGPAMPKMFYCIVHWNDGSSFFAKMNQQNISNMNEVAAVDSVEVGDEI